MKNIQNISSYTFFLKLILIFLIFKKVDHCYINTEISLSSFTGKTSKYVRTQLMDVIEKYLKKSFVTTTGDLKYDLHTTKQFTIAEYNVLIIIRFMEKKW